MKYSYRFSLARAGAGGNAPLRCRISFGGIRTDIRLGCSIPVSCWNSVLQTAIAHTPQQKHICIVANNAITHTSAAVERLFSCCIVEQNRYPLIAEVRNLVTHRISSMYLSAAFEAYITAHPSLKPASVKLINAAMKSIIKHNNDTPVGLVDENFVSVFIQRASVNYHNSTIRNYTDRLRTVMRWCAQRYGGEINTRINTSLNSDPKKILCLSPNELHRICKLKLKNETQSIVRDMFLLEAFTGLRISDIRTLSRCHIHGNELHIVTTKTAEPLVIELNHYAAAIIRRRTKNTKGNALLFKPIGITQYHKALRQVCKLAGIIEPVECVYYQGSRRITQTKPKYQWVTSHTARKTFVANAIHLGIPVEVIMRWTGHHSSQSIKPYISILSPIKRRYMQRFDTLFTPKKAPNNYVR